MTIEKSLILFETSHFDFDCACLPTKAGSISQFEMTHPRHAELVSASHMSDWILYCVSTALDMTYLCQTILLSTNRPFHLLRMIFQQFIFD